MKATSNSTDPQEKFNILQAELGRQYEPLGRCWLIGQEDGRLQIGTESPNECAWLQARRLKLEQQGGFALEFVCEEPELPEPAEPELEETKPFGGWEKPVENWSRLPHAMIEALPIVETVAELKVILYILRHTWGYGDPEKRISLDEFQHGRRRSQAKGGGRLDPGTGLSRNAVRDGIRRAIDHGFIKEDRDHTDKARLRITYKLRQRGVKD